MASIDADLQDPPEKLAEMLDAGPGRQLDIVYGVRADRSSDTVTKRRHAPALYYWLMRRLAGVAGAVQRRRLPAAVSRATVDVLRELPEHQPSTGC